MSTQHSLPCAWQIGLQLAVRMIPLLVLSACSSAPVARQHVFERHEEVMVVADKPHRRVETYVNYDAMRERRPATMPFVRVAAGAHDATITRSEAALVANHAARSACLEMAKYVVLQRDPSDDALALLLVVTAIRPTVKTAASASWLVGIVAPTRLRVPVGLGGLAIEGEVRERSTMDQLALVRWARGANAVTENAKISSIGDAWQLAGDFGKYFAGTLMDSDVLRRGVQRARLNRDQVKSNRLLCALHFGALKKTAQGASLLLPLAPSTMDPGPPVQGQRVSIENLQ
jgi:hypothetical protein